MNEDAGSTGGQRIKRVLTKNVIALIIRPKRSANDGQPTAPELAPKYAYDSRAFQATPDDETAKLSRNQLPPLVHMTMVAIDEKSAARLDRGAATPPDFGLANLFKTSGKGIQLAHDLATLEATLNDDAHRVTYRVFSTDVSIPEPTSTGLLGGAALLGLVSFRERRHLARRSKTNATPVNGRPFPQVWELLPHCPA